MPKQRKANAKKEPTQTNIPSAVQAQGDKADELLTAAEPDPDVIIDKIVDDPVADPKLEPVNPVAPVTDPEPKIEPVPKVEPDPKVEPLPDDKTDWKHKYDVLQGMYNKGQKDVGDLSETVKNLQTMVNQQSTLMQQPKPEPVPAAAATPKIEIDKLKEEDYIGYGDEIGVMARNFNKLIDINEQLLAKIDSKSAAEPVAGDRLARIESMVQETAQERYTRELDNSVPKWREIVNDATFTGWLQGIDGVSNYRWKDMMDSAYAGLKHAQVTAIIKRYSAETGIDIGQPAATPAPAAEPANTGATNIVDQTVDPLAAQSMPGETTGGDQGQTAEDIPTAEDVKKASAKYAQKQITIKEFNAISDRFQKGLAAKKQ
jgi:hypothetical protein